MIQRMPLYALGKTECSARRTENLAIWVAHGHSEAEIRALVKASTALAPLPTGRAEPLASGDPSVKPRSRSTR